MGDEVAVGQVIGLIEAMKLFNEIKSDLAGRVARVCVENGSLVKAKQPLIEVEPRMTQPPIRAVRLTGWGRYAPSQVLSNADLERMVDTSDEWIVTRTGIRERRVAAAHETTASMGAVAGLRAIRTAGHRARRHRRHHPRDPHARLLDAVDGRARQGGDRQYQGGRVRRHGRLLGLRVRLRDGHAYITAGLAKHVLVIGAELLTRFLDYTDRSTCILFGDGAGAVVLSASDEPTAPGRHRAHDRAPGRVHDLAARRRVEAPAVARDHRPRRAQDPDGGQGDLPLRDADARVHRARGGRRRRASTPDDIDLIIPHQANVRIIEAVAKGLGLSMDRMFINLDRYGNTSAASVPIALAEAVNEGRVESATSSCSSPSARGSRPGAVAMEWTADPARGPLGDAAVRPEDVEVRLPVDWDSVDPIPPALAEIVRRPIARVEVPLDDVVPGEPEHAHQPVR